MFHNYTQGSLGRVGKQGYITHHEVATEGVFLKHLYSVPQTIPRVTKST